jgi:hypothetical protein
MNIVKQSTGNVVLTDAAGNIQKVFVNVNALDVKGTDEVIVKFGFNQWHSLFASQVSNTQVEPAGAVAFSGNAFDLVALLSSSFFFELSGGGGGDDLATVLIAGNTSGANDIEFDSLQGLLFANNSRLREGTIDAGLGGLKGIAQICGAGYELKWEGGVLYVMGSSGNTIRWSLYNFSNTPAVTDDNTTGYQIGSRWTLDDGSIYLCSDASTGAAVWTLQSSSVATLAQVLIAGNSAAANNIDLNNNDLLNVDTITASGNLTLNPVGSIDCNGKTIDMTGGEIHKIPLIHSQNNVDLTIEGKGTADLVFKTNNVDRLKITDTGVFTGLPEAIQLAASDETTALTTGTGKVTFRMPFAMTLMAVRASLTTAQASGSIFTVDINESGTSILSTKLTIDNTEKTNKTAATPAVISDTALADDAEITIDIDQIGDGTATGLKITLIGTR